LGLREKAHSFTEDLLSEQLKSTRLALRDRALIHELVNGTVRWQATLDWLIDRRSHGRQPEGPLRVFLRLGLYQLFWLDRVPDHAAVNETVNLVRDAGLGLQAAYANALLRGYVRDRDETTQQLEELKTATPALGWSHPAWLIARWQTQSNPATLLRLLEWNNAPPPNFARVNTLKTDAGTLLKRWREENVEYDFGRWDWIPENLVFELKAHPPLPQLGSFRDGWFYVQDPSTLLAVTWLDPEPGHDVLDVCAAPGGKTTFIAERVENESRVRAEDVSPARIELIRANCARLGITCVETGVVPETSPPPSPESARFDRILLDAPCSNTGVLRRRVDLRWRLRIEEIQRLAALQRDLLSRSLDRLDDHSRLVYSTCSLEPEENRQVVDAVLAAKPGFRLVRDRALHPARDRVDGAYVAVIEN
jgi:16S rRNA (cytosine967-C5)-methyltransferase